MGGFEETGLAAFDRWIGRDRPPGVPPNISDPAHDRSYALMGYRTGRGLRGEEAVALCDGVIDLMAVLFSTCGRQLRSPKRYGRSVARVRQIGMYIAHVTLGMRMRDVATGFGRDKSTVVHACHVIEDMRDDAEFDELVARTERIVRIAFRLHNWVGGESQ